MKAIYSVFFYILLAIVLCSPNVSTSCGSDEQVEDFKKALIMHEAGLTLMTTLSAIPITSVAIISLQVMSAGKFIMRLKTAFNEMESSLNKDHENYKKCSEILDKTERATTIIESTTIGFSLVSLIPVFSLALVPSRVTISLTAMLVIRDGLVYWQEYGCQNATTRDCNL